MITIIEAIQNKGDMQCLLFDLQEKERFTNFEKLGRDPSCLFVIVYEQQDWTDRVFSFSEKLYWVEAVIMLNDIKNRMSKRNSYFSYNESDLRITYAANDIDIHEYRIVTAKEAKEIIEGLYKANALECEAPQGWSRQLLL